MSAKSLAMVAVWAVWAVNLTAQTNEANVVEEVAIYSTARAAGVELRVWGMRLQERDGFIYLNEDWKPRPNPRLTVGLRDQTDALVTLTPGWLDFGYLRFAINGLADPYGEVGSPGTLGAKLFRSGENQDPGQIQYGDVTRIANRCYDGGRGVDATIETWQTVLIPLRQLGANVGDQIAGLAIFCQYPGKPERAFALGPISLVRFSGVRPKETEAVVHNVAQPWVTWPTYDALPAALKIDQNPLLYRDETFVTADGRRAFLCSAWGGEDQRQDLGIDRKSGHVVPNLGLYDPGTQGFIYEQPLDAKSLSRLGFNAFANQVLPGPFYKVLGCPPTNMWGRDVGTPELEQEFLDHVRRIGGPFYVDMACFPYTLGWPGEKANTTSCLPPEALHNGSHHWVPYRLVGQGREVWLTLWRTYAQRYKDAGARVIFYELMNEPLYRATTPDHRAGFVAWLKQRYGTVAQVNAAWGTEHADWGAIRDIKDLWFGQPGLFFDYDEYLGDCYRDLVVAGRDALEAITPGVPAAVQSLGRHEMYPGDAVFLSKLIPVQRAVLTPTGGGYWTSSAGNTAPRKRTLDYGMSGSPVGMDLLRAMAGDKMIVDNEMYCNGPTLTRADMRNRWWRAVISGQDGASWFAWNKRGWAWSKGREGVLKEGDLYPYSGLIPFTNRADLIRGHLDFAVEMERVREYVLPKPWGPQATIGFLYSWANARWRKRDPRLRDKSGYYHASMKYLHWNLEAIPSHLASPATLARHRLLVAGGLDFAEPELVKLLTDYVVGGGCLVVGEGTMNRDLYGKAIATEELLGVEVLQRAASSPGELTPRAGEDFGPLPGEIVSRALGNTIELLAGTDILWADAEGKPAVTCRTLGRGQVYYIAVDLIGYPLAKLLGSIAASAGVTEPLRITDETTGQLAPNILVSRRSYPTHHALLSMNGDRFPKLMRIRIDGLEGNWHVTDPLNAQRFASGAENDVWTATELSQGGLLFFLAGADRGLLLLTRAPWTKTPLMAVREADTKALFEAELAGWEQRRQGEAHGPFVMDPSRAHYVDLKAAANATVENVVTGAKTRFQGFPFTETAAQDLGGVPFEIIRWDHNEERGFVAVRSKATPHHPAAVKGIRVGARAARVFFLHTCGEGKDGERLGHYALRYANGTSVEVPLVVGATIGRLADRFDRDNDLATVLVTASGSAWHVLEWKNPKPEALIESLDLVAAPGASGTVVIVAVTVDRNPDTVR